MAWSFLGRPGRPWRNWSRNVSAFPERVFYPKSFDDLVAIIQLARVERKKIRLAGDSHSWSPLVATNEFLVFTKRLKGVDLDLSEATGPRVTVYPGTTIEEFNEACREHGLVLPTNVVPTNFHMAAVAATGSHGTGIRTRTVPDYVEAVEIIDSDGRLRRFTKEGDPEVFNAARLSLGMFGVIWRTTFRVMPAVNVRELDDFEVEMESAIPRFEEVVTSHEYTELVWWPFNRKMWLKHYDAIAAEASTGFCRRCWRQFVQRAKLRAGRLIYGVMMAFPSLTPALMRLIYRGSARGQVDEIIPLEWAIHYQDGLKIVRATNAEVAFPVSPGFENVQHAWRVVVSKTQEYQARGSYPFNMALVVRFVSGTSIRHSPAYGEELMCFIEITSFADTKDWVPFSTDVLTEWLKIPRAKPHWAKEMRQFPVSAFREAYGDHLRDFLEIRTALGVDPDNMFVNDFLEEVFFGK